MLDIANISAENVGVWLWLASVWGGGWLMSKSPLLQPHILFDAFGDMSIGDQRAFVLVLGVITVGVVSGALFFVPATPQSLPEKLKWLSGVLDSRLFWSGPFSMAFGGVFCCVTYLATKNKTGWLGKKISNIQTSYLAEKNAIFRLVQETIETGGFTMLTLSNKKVYVGTPWQVSDWKNPNPSKQHLYFIPFLSGYRHTDSLALELTTNYAEVLRRTALAKIDDFKITVSVDNIIHAQPFNLDFYDDRATLFSLQKPKN